MKPQAKRKNAISVASNTRPVTKNKLFIAMHNCKSSKKKKIKSVVHELSSLVENFTAVID